MKAKSKYYKEGRACPSCNWMQIPFFQLNGWDKKDWICGSCFAEELVNSEADYSISTKRDIEDLKHKAIKKEFGL